MGIGVLIFAAIVIGAPEVSLDDLNKIVPGFDETNAWQNKNWVFAYGRVSESDELVLVAWEKKKAPVRIALIDLVRTYLEERYASRVKDSESQEAWKDERALLLGSLIEDRKSVKMAERPSQDPHKNRANDNVVGKIKNTHAADLPIGKQPIIVRLGSDWSGSNEVAAIDSLSN